MIDLSPPFSIMGVINVTPDSFSDGGDNFSVDQALQTAGAMLEAGADILDLGAESTRPGATPVDLPEELDRILPVVAAIAREFPSAVISIDSRKDEVFMRCAALGARWFNRVGDVPAPDVMKALAKIPGATLAVTHIHGDPQTMQANPLDEHAAPGAVSEFFNQSTGAATAAGWSAESLWLDPGIGFGKTVRGNLALLSHLTHWTNKNQVMVGVSRKSFMGKLFDIPLARDRDVPGRAIEAMCVAAGARLIRTHNVSGLARMRRRMMEGN